ncbi:MAG: DUF1232 domain-containing protein [Myxococcales bacterium]|nr:DUF1232 domain-containing protein [Myxococcales bacterium]
MNDAIAELKKVAARWLPTFQHDLKDFVRVVADDPELDDGLRAQAVGVALYCLAPGDVIPDSVGVVGYLDDALALRVVLAAVQAQAPARFDAYRERVPELVESVGEDLAVFRAVLGEVYTAFEARVAASVSIEFKGKNARALLDEGDGATWLQEEVSEKALKLDFKASAVDSAVRQVDGVVAMFRARLLNRR